MKSSQSFECKCKKTKGWITENQYTEPCPNCGRVYVGIYNPKTLHIEARQVA